MNTSSLVEILLSVLFLPALNTFINFAWGVGDPNWLMMVKRIFVLLPILAIILGYWVTIVSLLSLVIRAERRSFITAILVTWWDLGRAIFSFWGGVFNFLLTLTTAVFGVLRLAIVGFWVLLQDIVLIPFRVVGNISLNVLNPTIPWIAVGLTLFWSVFEAIIFTYVMSPLVLDTLSNMTGNALSENFIKLPLFLFMLFVVLGSYSVLSTWTEAIKTRNIPSIIKISAIEAVALFVEVVFLYREFVDALVPWFAQHSSGNFDLGIFGTLFIASATWFGIRSLSWFLFASSGTPTIMAIIQGTGLKAQKGPGATPIRAFNLTVNLMTQIKTEAEWTRKRGEDVLGAFILPPLQVVAGAINFCTLFITTKHLFELPFKNVEEIKNGKALLQQFERGGRAARTAS